MWTAYMWKVFRLHEDLHEVGHAPGRIADDEHEGDGDAGSSNPDFAFPNHIGRVARTRLLQSFR